MVQNAFMAMHFLRTPQDLNKRKMWRGAKSRVILDGKAEIVREHLFVTSLIS